MAPCLLLCTSGTVEAEVSEGLTKWGVQGELVLADPISASQKLKNAAQVKGKIVVVHRDTPELVNEKRATPLTDKAKNVVQAPRTHITSHRTRHIPTCKRRRAGSACSS